MVLVSNKSLFSSVKSGNFGHQVHSDIHLQTVKIQMRRLLMSYLISIFTVCLVNLFFYSNNLNMNKQRRCLNLPDVRSYLTLPYCKQVNGLLPPPINMFKSRCDSRFPVLRALTHKYTGYPSFSSLSNMIIEDKFPLDVEDLTT